MTSERLSWLVVLIIALVCQLVWMQNLLTPPDADAPFGGEVTASAG